MDSKCTTINVDEINVLSTLFVLTERIFEEYARNLKLFQSVVTAVFTFWSIIANAL